MTFLRMSRLLSFAAAVLLALSIIGSNSRTSVVAQSAVQSATQSPIQVATGTPAGTPVASCNSSAATSTAPSTAQSATEAATEVATEAAMEATQDASAPISYISFMPTDIHFNPNSDKPFALITVYSLIFKSQLGSSLHIEKPQFQLAIDGVAWGQLVSTDFQTGQLMPHAEQGIVLQNLTIISKTTPEQQAILECLKAYHPVNLTLTGTIDAFPNGTRQSVAITLITRQVVLNEHH